MIYPSVYESFVTTTIVRFKCENVHGDNIHCQLDTAMLQVLLYLVQQIITFSSVEIEQIVHDLFCSKAGQIIIYPKKLLLSGLFVFTKVDELVMFM